MRTETLPSLRPGSNAGGDATGAAHDSGQPSPMKFVLEPPSGNPTGYRAAWSFFHREHQVEIDLLSSNLQELRSLKAELAQEHQEKVCLLGSLLEEIRQLKEVLQASSVLATMNYLPLISSYPSSTSEPLSPPTPQAMQDWQFSG